MRISTCFDRVFDLFHWRWILRKNKPWTNIELNAHVTMFETGSYCLHCPSMILRVMRKRINMVSKRDFWLFRISSRMESTAFLLFTLSPRREEETKSWSNLLHGMSKRHTKKQSIKTAATAAKWMSIKNETTADSSYKLN